LYLCQQDEGTLYHIADALLEAVAFNPIRKFGRHDRYNLAF
jgi:hypothetical protein